MTDERYGEIEYRDEKVLHRWRGSGGNVRPSYLLMGFLFTLHVYFLTLCEPCCFVHWQLELAIIDA